MRPWIPDWKKMIAQAPDIPISPGRGYVYLIADSHLGDARAPTEEFFQMLGALPEAKLVVFLGDLFKVWMAVPKFWNDQVRGILDGFRALRKEGVPILFLVGNRDYFLPVDDAEARRRDLPFDFIAPDICTISWGKFRYGLSHGDIINRADLRHLKSRWITRSWPFEAVFGAIPGRLALAFAFWMEKALADTNMDIKIQFPLAEIETFADTVMDGLDCFFVGHFHREEVLDISSGRGRFWIVPDWHSRKTLLRIDQEGNVTRLHFSDGEGLLKG